ncbi:Actin-related protein 6 (dArp6) (Actin-like protein 13E), partial [Durusdinium trenchii]
LLPGRMRLVVDNGGAHVKCGFAGQEAPWRVPNCTALVKGELAPRIGTETEDVGGLGRVTTTRALERGYLTRVDTEAQVWDQIVAQVIGGAHLVSELVVTLPPVCPKEVEDALDNLVRAHFHHRLTSYTKVVPAALCAVEQGLERSFCLVIDAGFSFTHVVPVFDGAVFEPGVRRLDVGGKLLTNYLKELVSFAQINVMDETAVVEQLKHDVCYVSQDISRDLDRLALLQRQPLLRVSDRLSARDRAALERTYTRRYVLPDFDAVPKGYLLDPDVAPEDILHLRKQIVTLSTECLLVPEVLFNPSILGLPQAGLSELVLQVLDLCPAEVRPVLQQNVIVTGGSSLFPNLVQRLQRDLGASAGRAMTARSVTLFLLAAAAATVWVRLRRRTGQTQQQEQEQRQQEQQQEQRHQEQQHQTQATEPPANQDAEDDLGHERPIPQVFVDKIPADEVLVIRFLLDYLAWRKLPVDGLLVNGGYVRDLLLGKVPDDLDISVFLKDCEPHVTVEWILGDLPNFVASFPGAETEVEHLYGFASLRKIEITGDISKNKKLDTAKAVFGFLAPAHPTSGERCKLKSIEVDLMPTIGEESYQAADHRIPTRDQRGTPKQDALRRDLTIGAMLIKVAYRDDSNRELGWTLLDFYGGLADLRNKVLRAPDPGRLMGTFTQPGDLELCKVVGLDPNDTLAAWWVKILRDDPVRILRVFRFAAKLNFRICPSFWTVIPFALDALQLKVAGSRKMTEILKLAKYGNDNVVQFFSLCFRKRFVHNPRGETTCLAPVIFGGQDGDGGANLPSLPQVSADELLGCFLAVAVFSARFVPAADWAQEPQEDGSGDSVPLLAAERACNGLCTSNEMRQSAVYLLQANERLIALFPASPPAPPSTAAIDGIFEQRLANRVRGLAAAQHPPLDNGDGTLFRAFVTVWEVLRLSTGATHYSRRLVLALLEHGAPPAAHEFVKTALELFLESPSPPKLTGKGISQLKKLPPRLRGIVLVRLVVLLRLNNVTGIASLDRAGALEEFLQTQCDALYASLLKEFYVDDSHQQLKEAYARKPGQVSSNKAKQKNKSKKSKAKSSKT